MLSSLLGITWGIDFHWRKVEAEAPLRGESRGGALGPGFNNTNLLVMAG